MLRRKICVLVNPYAGNAWIKQVLIKVETALRNHSLDYRIIITNNKLHAQELAIQAARHEEIVAVMGGDGSVRVVAEVLMNHKGVLAILPAGRGNDFARMLGYPSDAVSACQVLAEGRETVVDMGQVNNNPFLTICSLGFDSVVNNIANRTAFFNGRAVYLYAGLRALPSWRSIKFKIKIDGKTFEHIGYTVAVANSQYYGGGMQLVPPASIYDGLLDVVLIGDIPKYRLLVNLPRIFKGTHINEKGFSIIRGRHIHIEADPQYGLFADGDAICTPPANISILPKALRVLIPNKKDVNSTVEKTKSNHG